MPKYQSWIIEGNRVRRIQDIPDNVDLEVEVSPFLSGRESESQDMIIEKQAEVFAGNIIKYSGWGVDSKTWTEQEHDIAQPEFCDLTVLGSANPLFAGKHIPPLEESLVKTWFVFN